MRVERQQCYSRLGLVVGSSRLLLALFASWFIFDQLERTFSPVILRR